MASSVTRKDYDLIIIHLFKFLLTRYGPDAERLSFTKEDIVTSIRTLDLRIRNVPDVTYTYRVGRSDLPQEILAHGNWAIEGTGKGSYAFVKLKRPPYVTIPTDFEVTEILDATPLIVLRYQKSDEQAMLAQLRYNRLIDIFTGLTAYHLQSHYRTTVQQLGQVEIDDLYIGVNTHGQGYVLPVEAKSTSQRDKLGVIQITQMVRFAQQYYSSLPVIPIGVKALEDGTFMFFEFTVEDNPDLLETRRIMRYRLIRDR